MLLILGVQHVYALEFGRLFTTPSERERLDELRRAHPGAVIEVSTAELDIDQEVVEETVQRDSLQVKGLVYRSDGKNSVWINESNSYEGDLTSEFTFVDSKRIHNNYIEISLPGDERNVTLKVGQQLDPQSGEIIDLTDEKRRNTSAPPGAPSTAVNNSSSASMPPPDTLPALPTPVIDGPPGL